MSVNASNRRALYYKALTAVPALIGLVVCAALPVTSAQAQISGGYTYQGGAYFITGNATVDGDISGSPVFVGKDTSFNTVTPTPPITLNVIGAFDGSSGAKIDTTGAGTAFQDLNLFGGNLVNITGGIVTSTNSHNTSTTNISGGVVVNVIGYDASTNNISAGGVYNTYGYFTARAADASTMNISGGSLTEADGGDTSTTNISGGNVKLAYGYGSGTFNISGGSVTDISALENSVFNITGGIIGGHSILLFNNSILNLTGTNLSLSSAIGTGTDGYGSYTLYSASGSLANGDTLNTELLDYDGGYQIAGGGPGNTPLYINGNPIFTAAAAPEPGSIVLLGLALPLAGGVMGRRKGRA